jgi:hypothetical protein
MSILLSNTDEMMQLTLYTGPYISLCLGNHCITLYVGLVILEHFLAIHESPWIVVTDKKQIRVSFVFIKV